MPEIAPTDPRAALATALSTWMTPEQVNTLIEQILALTKRAPYEYTCKHCKRNQRGYVEIPDAKAVTDSLANLANQAFGRPGEASGEDQTIVFKRLTRLDDDPALALPESGVSDLETGSEETDNGD